MHHFLFMYIVNTPLALEASHLHKGFLSIMDILIGYYVTMTYILCFTATFVFPNLCP